VEPPVQITVEVGLQTAGDIEQLGKRIEKRIREILLIRTNITMVKFGELPRSKLKTKLVEIRPGG